MVNIRLHVILNHICTVHTAMQGTVCTQYRSAWYLGSMILVWHFRTISYHIVPWHYYGSTMVILWPYYGTMAILWLYCSTMAILWLYYGSTMVLWLYVELLHEKKRNSSKFTLIYFWFCPMIYEQVKVELVGELRMVRILKFIKFMNERNICEKYLFETKREIKIRNTRFRCWAITRRTLHTHNWKVRKLCFLLKILRKKNFFFLKKNKLEKQTAKKVHQNWHQFLIGKTC